MYDKVTDHVPISGINNYFDKNMMTKLKEHKAQHHEIKAKHNITTRNRSTRVATRS